MSNLARRLAVMKAEGKKRCVDASLEGDTPA
jgi:hypothetical protein